MILHTSSRRILNFPAVNPCEGISPATLLRSLINLSQNICNCQPNLVATQRRNAREAIRQIGILLIFFEEIRDSGLVPSDSLLLCFSELHVAFQKVQFLLEDCSREGARLWILMKSHLVANQFRGLIRAIATALDVLPLNLVDVCGEVKELVELVAKQARKATFEVDQEDEWAVNQVLVILSHFEKGIEPEFSFVKRVLDYVEIRSWSDCNKEIKFLEEEIGLQSSNSNERDVSFLSSLLGLMSYSRGVVFESYHSRRNDQSDARLSVETLSCLNPEDFWCPISLELMTDPVTVSTGQTYDRASIEKWLKAGNTICPKTGEKLASTELVPNTTLRKLIYKFCADTGISLSNSRTQIHDITRTILPGSPAASSAMRYLSQFLARRLVFGTNEEKTKAAYEIRLLAKSNIFNRSCLIEAGTILPLINALSSLSEKFSQEIVMSAVLRLSKHTSGKTLIAESGGLVPIVAALKRGSNLETRQMAAATIFYLSSVKEYRKTIGETPELIPALVDLIKDGTTCGKKNAAVAIFGLLLHSGNHQKVLACGTVPLLIDISTYSDNDDLRTDCLAALAALAESADGTFSLIETSSLSIIPRILRSLSSKPGKEYCVSILLSLCKNGGLEAIEALATDHSLMSSLYSLSTDGTTQGSSKSRSLMRILHKFNERSSSELSTSGMCEQPVGVRTFGEWRRKIITQMSSSNSPCAACKSLRRKCTQECVFAPYFPPEQPQKFSSVHRVFGASNVTKLLNELNAVNSFFLLLKHL